MIPVNKLLENLNVSKILFIDDQLELSDDDKMMMLPLCLTKQKGNQELIAKLEKELGAEKIEKLFEQEDIEFLYEEDDERRFVFNALEKYDLGLLKGPAKQIEERLVDYFGADIIETASSPDEKDFKDFDLIIMDYDYSKEEFTALDIIKDKLNGDESKYIVFMSSHTEFTYEKVPYRMTDSESRQDLFRKYSSNNILEFKALLNYINKDVVQSKGAFNAAIYETLLELESGKLMFDSLYSTKSLLDKGVNDAISKLLLTNSKTMKALITEKLEIEGVSETTYLVELSLALVKNLIMDSVPQMQEIHEKLSNIQGWSCEIWDYETDNHLRDLRRIELLDENVNKRNAPIDFGDIFEMKIQDKLIRGILVSQSCDLMVREVKGNIQRNAEVASIILEVSEMTGKSCIPLRLGKEEVIFDVRKNILIPSWILDFTSLDVDNGNSQFMINQSIFREFTWGGFYCKYLTNLIEEKSNELKGFGDGEHTTWSHNIAYSFRKNHDNIAFNVSRVARLDYLHTSSILKQKNELETRVPLSLDISSEEIKFSPLETRLNSRETNLKFLYSEKDKCVLIDVNHFLGTIQEEGFKIKQEIMDGIITEIQTNHRKSLVLREQLKEKRMLIVDEETAGAFKQYGIEIRSNKKKKTVDVICRHEFIGTEMVGQK
ncbi:hypothetical protein BKP37_07000 [Anaerobacillus alkalilacustris]|uniref:Response receiver domain-containing protein n=1 Tax=Anaerobacillus alkalilacustris TaxID=393763 RepID=A0A1S2LRA6_9BACI|nr:hypothetical protein [Anaerobacillus alkalilacustris]OIJ14926.1 hypothetical protein BKP37_07000 [Anaerobacillus alkalilacustris]